MHDQGVTTSLPSPPASRLRSDTRFSSCRLCAFRVRTNQASNNKLTEARCLPCIAARRSCCLVDNKRVCVRCEQSNQSTTSIWRECHGIWTRPPLSLPWLHLLCGAISQEEESISESRFFSTATAVAVAHAHWKLRATRERVVFPQLCSQGDDDLRVHKLVRLASGKVLC